MPKNKPSKFQLQDLDAGGFVQVPNKFLRESGLSSNAMILLIMLKSHKKGWVFNQTQIAKSLGWGVDRLKSTVKELELKEHLSRIPAKTDTGAIIPGPWVWSFTFFGGGVNRGSDNPPDGLPPPISKTSSKNNISQEPPNPQGDDDLFGKEDKEPIPILSKQDFENFWQFYKSRVPAEIVVRSHKAKTRAAIIKKAVEHKDAMAIIGAVSFCLIHPAFSKDNFQFMPALHRFIRDERYEAYLGKTVDNRSRAEIREENEMKDYARLARKGLEKSIPMQLSLIPMKHRHLFDEKDRKRFGWE